MKLQRRSGLFALATVLSAGIAACGPRTEAPTAGEAGGGQTASGGTVALSGAGATFPAPLYQRWFAAYNSDVDSGVQVSYQSVGSGAGLEQYINGTVDFGASDAPITGDRLESFQSEYNAEPIQLPMAGGAVVLAYNLPQIEGEELRLSREAYCGIVTGEITTWNDPAIAAENEGLDLPAQEIVFAHRSDGSGTTFIFVNHIDSVCPNWAAGVGTSVDWPAGQGGQGNEGVSGLIQQNEGAIGYVEFAYAKLNDIPMATLENSTGNYIEPSAQTASLAFDGEEIPEDFGLLVPDPTNEGAYPIAGLTWLMVYPQYDDPQRWQTLRNVIEWSLTDGRSIAEELDYVPMPDSIVERIRTALDEIQA
ncbi:phosphate ABC transporter substrate-binding protein PstS [Oculatella sp. LEGE 06141]|uniref:phosphate ABC transporter substrate-binding protein PstS n=1 Tax=Oculatella sp. LEGE 06141 TaxID=1828648 RepID=UPI00188289A5|nr:phosphate ABC transporter substrate-binding protein PstS [Oculatella sp. LEGE 06141]MBE9182231.1 phosphate ABC transporter substrate-binding protein PstS [Oculatella sp. LEGE 06141]